MRSSRNYCRSSVRRRTRAMSCISWWQTLTNISANRWPMRESTESFHRGPWKRRRKPRPRRRRRSSRGSSRVALTDQDSHVSRNRAVLQCWALNRRFHQLSFRKHGEQALLLRAVAVQDLDSVTCLAQVLAHILGDHDRAMLSSGAAERNRQIAFAFANVVRQQVNQEIRNAVNEFGGLRKGTDVAGDAGIFAGKRAELGHEVRIGQEADIEDEVGVFRHAVFEAEAHAGDQNVLVGRVLLE